MAKVYPKAPIVSPYLTLKRESFTIWMKSLLCHSNGCTVFDSDGQIVYRVDNYDKKCRNEVYLMDLRGKVLFTIKKKKLLVFESWEGYKWSSSSTVKKEKPWFKVKKYCKYFFMGDLACKVSAGHDNYWMVRSSAGKADFKIVNNDGNIIAEANQKQSSSGILLGEDVLTLRVEPYVDHSFIVALVTVYGLVNRKM
ncbi:hypothetical protein Patl1_17739 [Pistacia atlantica]|uniref:Uncharacterized protein n=1 Tax=Pistacia atlantica TaxID=434234 RepID=A0ACC1BY05_9ROSI|nr:hypothetical protein Patl1_17739 [Pistacia atlantica]